MINKEYTGTSFDSTYTETVDNSLLIDNCSERVEIMDGDEPAATALWRNRLLNEFFPQIISTAMWYRLPLPPETYYYKPRNAASDMLSNPDYWFLILKLNGYNSKYDFKDFGSRIIIPDRAIVENLILQMEAGLI